MRRVKFTWKANSVCCPRLALLPLLTLKPGSGVQLAHCVLSCPSSPSLATLTKTHYEFDVL